ncbi:MAG: RNA polymerase sigma factor [bacterium]
MEWEKERELTERAKKSDEAAFEDLVRAHQKKLYNFIYRLCENHDDAAEITQRAFVKAYFSLRNFRGDSLFRTWLFRIALNTFRNHMRDEGRRKHQTLDGWDPPAGEKTFSMMVQKEERKKLAEAVETLPPRQREAVVLRVHEGHSFSEVAGIMGCSVGAAKASYHQGVKKLKEAIGGDEG